MAEHDDRVGWQSSTRGEAAWLEAREQVESRNSEARKLGKQQREAYEQSREDARRAAATRRHAELLKRRNG
jgi:hypothetical protein